MISDMVSFLTEAGVGVRNFAPHTTPIFEVFDVTLFDVLKRHPRYKLPFGDDEVNLQFLTKVYHGLKQRTVDFDISRAF
jgi:hypothetical protein